MDRIVEWLRLIRARHYIKNGLVFTPLFFNGSLGHVSSFLIVMLGAFFFCMAASAIYIVNDLNDCEKDRLHPVKCRRPIASGKVSPKAALQGALLLVVISVIGGWLLFKGLDLACFYLALYFFLNLAYSYRLKNIPLLEIAILASGFVLRILFGGAIAEVDVSNWLFLTVLSVSFYMGLGKRRNEMISNKENETRKVLAYYNKSFLDKNMYMFLALSIAFYSLWSMEHARELMIWTVPLVMLICMRYSLVLERHSEGDPVDIILKDKALIVLGCMYAAFTVVVLYC